MTPAKKIGKNVVENDVRLDKKEERKLPGKLSLSMITKTTPLRSKGEGGIKQSEHSSNVKGSNLKSKQAFFETHFVRGENNGLDSTLKQIKNTSFAVHSRLPFQLGSQSEDSVRTRTRDEPPQQGNTDTGLATGNTNSPSKTNRREGLIRNPTDILSQPGPNQSKYNSCHE